MFSCSVASFRLYKALEYCRFSRLSPSVVLFTWEHLIPASESGSEGYPVSMGRLQRSFLFIAHRTARIRRELTDWHFILTSSKGCVYATPPQIWWEKTTELPQQPRVSSLKVTDCFLSEVVWHSVPDKLGMMEALCLLEPTKPLTLPQQFCQTTFLWLPAEPGKNLHSSNWCWAHVPLLMVRCGCLCAPSHQAPKHTNVRKED